MSDDITIIEQKEIAFQEETLTAVMVQDEDGRENVYVPLRPLVEGMGLNWSSQYKRTKKNPVLNNVCISVSVSETETGRGKGAKRMLAIPISHLNGFLFGISADRVKEKLRPHIIAYQEQCYKVLFNAFNGTESMVRFYKAVGFDSRWIDARIKKHETGTELSDVWLINGIPIEMHDVLDSIINEGAFGLTVADHKRLKNLSADANLRDNMTSTELLISVFGDEATLRLIENEAPENLDEHTQLAKAGGSIAGEMRELFEKRTGSKVLSEKNYLEQGKQSLGKSKTEKPEQ